MFLAAVTGTDGKTTTVEFTRQLLEHAGIRAASWGSLGLVTARGRDPSPAVSVGRRALGIFLEDLDYADLDAVAFEAFSSSLAGGFLEGVEPDVAAFTSFGRDHLDLHGTPEAYFQAKLRLFSEVLPPGGTAVLHTDLPRYPQLLEVCRERGHGVRSFGRNGELRLHDVRSTAEGVQVTLEVDGVRFDGPLPLFGTPMVESVLCACGLARAAGVPAEDLLAALPGLHAPPGRMEPVGRHRGARIFVDAAHTPEALRRALVSLRAAATGRLSVVFGCGGERDPGKRALMGRVARGGADRVYVTDDNARGEDPATIREAILEEVPDGREVPDREAAIHRAVAELGPGDVLLVAGRGDEDTLEAGGGARPLRDADAVADAIAPPNAGPVET